MNVPVNPELQVSPSAVPVAKKKKTIVWIIIIVIVIFVVLGAISAYNKMVRLEKTVDEKWANVETQLQRRGDLIGNLVATVKRYAKHEEKVFIEVAKARSSLNNAATPKEYAQASGEISSVLSRLMLVVEAYPELKANENFLQLQAQLEGTENRINYARLQYNEIVKEYNTTIRQFPNVLFAGMFGFSQREFFKAEEGARKVPDVGKMLEE